jgi:hypothetical protein
VFSISSFIIVWHRTPFVLPNTFGYAVISTKSRKKEKKEKKERSPTSWYYWTMHQKGTLSVPPACHVTRGEYCGMATHDPPPQLEQADRFFF